MTSRFRAQLGTHFKRRSRLPSALARRRSEMLGEGLADSPVRLAVAVDASPEHRLILAVLMDAITIVLCMRDRACSSRTFAEARDWVFSDDTSWPYAFRNICEALDIDANRLRRRLTDHATTCFDEMPFAATLGMKLDFEERDAWCNVIRPAHRTTGIEVSSSL